LDFGIPKPNGRAQKINGYTISSSGTWNPQCFWGQISFREPPFGDYSSRSLQHWKLPDSSIHRSHLSKPGHLRDPIQWISQITLECSVWRENKSNNLCDTIRWYWQTSITPIENCMSGRVELTTSI
jgi:hypothetical protein